MSEPVAQNERIAMAREVEHRGIDSYRLRADAWRPAIADFHAEPEGLVLFDLEVEHAFPRLPTRPQLRIDLADVWILTQEFERLLECLHVQRPAGTASERIAQPPWPKPPVALDLDLREPPLNEGEVYDPILEILIFEQRA